MGGQAALERVRPEQAGVASQGILDFLDLVEDKQINMHSFMLLRHGRVAAEAYYRPFDGSMLQPVYSVSKSVTSAAVGMAVGEGRLSLEDRVIDFFPDKLSEPVHPYTAGMKVKHLLAMSTVHPKSADTSGEDWVRSFLTTPPSRAPGAVFGYDTTGTHALCAILQKLTGLTVHQYLKPRLFEAIGMGEIEWDSCPMGINMGGGGIRCTTEDMARFGQLYLQKGVWGGRRVLPEGWTDLSTARRIDNSNARILLDGQKGYGYQFWRCRNRAYCAFGMGGQFIVVIPEKDAVFVSTANTLMHKDGHQMILDALWEAVYPALREVEPAPDARAYEALQRRLDRLSLVLPEGRAVSPVMPEIAGKRWRLEPNRLAYETCGFDFDDARRARICFFRDGVRSEMAFGLNRWETDSEPFMGLRSANAGTWVDERTCVVHIQLLDRLQMFMLTCRFERDAPLVMHIMPAGAHRKETEACCLNGSLIR